MHIGTGPEQARLLMDFEEQYADAQVNVQQHHEEGLTTRKTFCNGPCPGY